MTGQDRLSMHQAQAWVKDGDRYQPVSSAVHARQLRETQIWHTSSGSTMRGKPGDWLISEGDEEWTVDQRIFEESYEEVGVTKYRKASPVRARQLENSTTLETLEGTDCLSAGDWIVMNNSGECWGMPDTTFRERYSRQQNPTGEPSPDETFPTR